MSVIFDDDFSAYTPGQDPFGSWVEDNALHGQVVNFAVMTGSTPAPGFYERVGKGYQMGVSGAIALVNPGNTPADAVTCVWAGWGNPVMTVSNLTGTFIDNAINIAFFSIEADGSISIRAHSTQGGPPVAGGALTCNSPTQHSWNSTWHYYQLNIITTSVAVGTVGTFVGFDGEAYVDGTLCCSVANWVTNIDVGTAAGPPFINMFKITGNGYIGDIFGANGLYRGYGTNTTGTGAYWPHPVYGTGSVGLMNAQVTQAAMETVRNFNQPEARQTQGIVETVRNFNQPAARMTQGIVEIILSRGGSGWRVYEA